MDSNIDKVREIKDLLENVANWRVQPYAGARYECLFCGSMREDHNDGCISIDAKKALAALSAIDPDGIRRECAEKAVMHAEGHCYCGMTDVEKVELRAAIFSTEPAQDDGKPEVGDDLETVAQVIQYHISAGGEYEYRGKIAMESFERIKRRLEEAKE